MIEPALLTRLDHFRKQSWWQDERRHFCAYCGTRTQICKRSRGAFPESQATRDHVIPKAHNGSGLTIPACRRCNTAKAAMSLPEFMLSSHFQAVRMERSENQWEESRLWFVFSLAALYKARSVEQKEAPGRCAT